MGIYMLNDFLTVPIRNVSTPLRRQVLYALAQHADDSDDDGRLCGGNIYPSVGNVAERVVTTKYNTREAIKELKDVGWVREHATERYLSMRYSNNKPKCNQINTSMLARLLDANVTSIILKMKQEERNLLIDAALEFQRTDWDTREWFRNYQARILDWDGTTDSIGPHLWDEYPAYHVHYSSRDRVREDDLAPQWVN